MSRWIFVLCACVGLAACGDDGSADGDGGGETGGDGDVMPLDCAWIESQNCWRDAVDAVRPCVPDDAMVGTLSPDRLSCDYDDGSVVTFDVPVADDPIDTEPWSFEIVTDGQSCLSYVHTTMGSTVEIEMTTSAGVLRMEGFIDDVGDRVLVACPDGSRWGTDQYLDLYESCPASEGGLPLLTVQSSPSQFSLEFGDEVDGDVNLFTCTP